MKSLQQGQRAGNPPEQSWGENHTEIMEETAKNGVKIIKKGKKPKKSVGVVAQEAKIGGKSPKKE